LVTLYLFHSDLLVLAIPLEWYS